MKILLIHNHYLQPGGEDGVFLGEVELLRSRGHEIITLVEDNARLNRMNLLKAATNAIWSRKSLARLRKAIREHRPDVTHFHNTFLMISPAAYYACKEAGVPVVQTLHNYRLLCPGALLMRNGRVCEDCVGKAVPWPGVVHGCWRGSRAQTGVVAAMLTVHRLLGTWREKVHLYIALTEFAKSKFVEAGIDPDKIAVKPNFVVDPFPDGLPATRRHGALFVGRLSVEKGITTLARAWRGVDYPLTMAGEGPQAGLLGMSGQIKKLGQVDRERVSALMTTSAFLVMPSEWYEGFPMVLVESFAHGLPVIASRLGSMAEIVEDGVTGLHFEPGDGEDLAEKVQWMIDHPRQCREMGENARRIYLEKYTPEINYRMLMQIYREAIDARKGARA